MKNFPSRIEVIIEPEQYSHTFNSHSGDIVQMTMRVMVNGKEISSRVIKPLDFFMSHFDYALENAKREILELLKAE